MAIVLEDRKTWPLINSVWRHYNGNEYRVLDYTNIQIERQDKYPTTIVYQNTHNNEKYSRPLVDWERSMKLFLDGATMSWKQPG